MTYKLMLKVKKFQLPSAKRFGTVEENLQGGFNLLELQLQSKCLWIFIILGKEMNKSFIVIEER